MGTDVTLATVRNEPDGLLYPREALTGLETALAGFSAAFLGRQDCVWLAEAGLVATCVDTDAERLLQMVGIYPDEWSFVCDDVFEYARRRYAEGASYDLVTLDPPTNLFACCAEELELWCALARRLVVLGTGRRVAPLVVPKGWKFAGLLRRSDFRGGVYWATLERS